MEQLHGRARLANKKKKYKRNGKGGLFRMVTKEVDGGDENRPI